MLVFTWSKYKQKLERTIGKSLMENQGLFMVISGIIPLWKWFTLLAFAILIFNWILFDYTCIYFYFIEFDLSRFAEVAHYNVVVFCGWSFYVVFWFEKDRLYDINKFLDINIYKYKSTIDPETEREILEMTEKMKTRKAKISKFLTIFYNVCGFCAIVLFPLIRSNSTQVSQNKIYMNIPAVCYFPLEGDLGWYVAVISQYLMTYFIVQTLNGSDVAFICFSEEGCNQLNILCHTIRCSLRRARYLHKIYFGEEPENMNTKRFSFCLKKCLNDSVKHHCAIISYFQEIQGLFSWCIMVVMMAGGIMLCLSGIAFFLDVMDFGTKLSFIFYLTGELTHNFLYAYYGQQISETSAEVREVLYEVKWEECSKFFKPYLLIMQAYTNTPIIIKGGGFMEYNLNTFGNVCSTAYSYFNLLSAAVHSDVKS